MKIIFSCLLVILLITCNNKQHKKEYVVEDDKIYEIISDLNSGQLISKFSFNRDSVLDGISKEFYSDGSLKNIFRYREGKLEGEQISFYPNINLKYFAINEGDSVAFEHPAIEIYEFYDKEEVLRYRRFYNKNGGVIRDEGSLFVTERVKSLSLIMGESFIAQFYLAKPPQIERAVYAKIIKGGSIIKIDTIRIDTKYNAAFVDIPLKEIGSYRIDIIAEMKNPYDMLIRQDTLIFDVTVSDEQSTRPRL